MKQAVLIEDRRERQLRFSEKTDIELEKYGNSLVNLNGETFIELKERFESGEFPLDEYSVIMTHRSAFDGNVLDGLKAYCKQHEKKLVFFSGGISQTVYLAEPFEFLLMNSKSFYSQNLVAFLESDFNLAILAYGKNWQVNTMLIVLEKINTYIGEMEDSKAIFESFVQETQLGLLSDMIDFSNLNKENRYITIEELERFSESVTKQIKEKVMFYA